jgi:hypothetical protein
VLWGLALRNQVFFLADPATWRRLATIISKNLVAKSGNFQPTIHPWFSLNSLCEQVNSVPHELLQELALRIPHGVHVGLCIEFHRQWMAKVVNPKRPFQFAGITPALMAAGRKYFCTMVDADSGFLPRSFTLRNTSLSLGYFVVLRHASGKPAKSGCMGTGAFDAFDFGSLNLSHT